MSTQSRLSEFPGVIKEISRNKYFPFAISQASFVTAVSMQRSQRRGHNDKWKWRMENSIEARRANHSVFTSRSAAIQDDRTSPFPSLARNALIKVICGGNNGLRTSRRFYYTRHGMARVLRSQNLYVLNRVFPSALKRWNVTYEYNE
jgi:hypothetical protein